MATNIIDAFVVTFGLDARGYKSGSRDVQKDFRDIKDEGKKAFGDIEKRGKDSASAVRGLAREAAGFFLLLAGANGLKNFAENMLTGAANADRLGETLGMSASRITGWQVAIKEMGGSAEDANGALQKMQDIIWQFKLGGGADPGLAAFGINPGDLQKGDPEALLMKLAEARGRFSAQEYAKRLQLLGLPQSVVYALEKGSVALRKQVDDAEKHANVTKKDAEAAEKLQKTLADLEAVIAGKLRPTVSGLAEDLTKLVGVIGTKDQPDSVNGVLIALGVAAAIVGRPFIVLAAAIGLVATNLDALKQKWQGFKDWYKQFDDDTSGVLDPIFDPVRKAMGLKSGAEARRDGTDVMGNPNGMAPGGGSTGGSAGSIAGGYIGGMSGGGGGGMGSLKSRVMTSLLSYGISPEVARGIVAGITAEGGGPNVRNPTSGAFGIGQWLGTRKKALFKQYGTAPSLDQQIAFLVSELKGGDHGGASVLSRNSAASAMVAYLRDFMRPGAGLSGDLARGYRDLGMNYRGRGGGGGTTNIGTIVVNTRATDAKGIARDIGSALRERAIVTQAAVGLTP